MCSGTFLQIDAVPTALAGDTPGRFAKDNFYASTGTKKQDMKITKVILLLGLSLCLGGCVTTQYTAGRDFDDTKASQIVKHKTTEDEIIAMFGTPYSKEPEVDDGERWTYSYLSATSHEQDRILLAGSKVETTGTKKNLYILFDKNKVVVNFVLDKGPLDKQTTITN